MCAPALPLAIGIAGALGAGATAYSASKTAKATKAAQASSEKQAAADAQRSEQQFNKANQKMPDIAAMFSRNREAAAQGMGATFLTGANGVGAGMLGGNTLLGS